MIAVLKKNDENASKFKYCITVVFYSYILKCTSDKKVYNKINFKKFVNKSNWIFK